MAPSTLIGQLEKIGRMLNRWGAEVRLTVGLSVLLFMLEGLALSDMLLRYQRVGRMVAWGLLVILSGVLAGRVARALSRRHTPEAVAVCVERAFPQLDNHLINYLLFSAASLKDSFMAAYVKMDIPFWSGLDFQTMKDRRTLRRAQLALAGAILLALVPCTLVGKAWPVAMWRIANPFSRMAPVSLTHVLSIAPGNSSLLQGGNLTVSCQVEGKAGHEVWLDVLPADGVQKTFKLGALTGRGEEGFSNTFYKVTTGMQYRFRAGDAFTPDWFKITLRPPLAFSSISVKVEPPAYMALPPKQYNAQATAIEIPAGSEVTLAVQCNGPLTGLTLSGFGAPVALARKGDDKDWGTSLLVTNGAGFILAAVAANGDRAETTLAFTLLPDRSPGLVINSPRQTVSLLPGDAPGIDFTVSDDFGLGEITVERVSDSRDKQAPVKVLKTYKWVANKGRDFTTLWKGDVRKASETGTLTLRVVAKDNRTGTPNVSVSPALVFTLDDVTAAAKKRDEQEKTGAADLNRVIELQRENLARTRQLLGVLDTSTPDQWNEAGGQQEAIRGIVKQLFEKGGGRCLGNLLGPVRKLYAGEMAEVIPALRGVPSVRDAAEKVKQVSRALAMEDKILRQLTFAQESGKLAQENNLNGSLIGMLDGIIVRQDKIIKATTKCAEQGVAVVASVTADQDGLGSEVSAFIKACRTEAAAGQGEDKDHAAFLESMASACEQGKIGGDMLLAAEQLEKNAPREAMPHEQNAYTKLLAARQKFEEVKAQAEKEKNQEMIEALQNASTKLEKLVAMEKKLIAEMDKVEENKDKSGKKTDMMEEEAEEIQKNIKEALLQVPRDLDIFAHLNVGNDLVEDVFSTFEEVAQAEGSGSLEGGPVKEKAVAKREYLAEQMEKVKGLIDDFEMWLKKAPDGTKVTVEAADKQEMPEGVALTPLQTEMNDIIGDLLKDDKEKQEQDADGAINAAVPDMEMGGPIMEGDTTTFSAKGKSGNEAPDHKEQDGRSNVGRQGMANGETAAGSGTIGKGDDNIEARRTQDPTQAGKVEADGEADTKATGGGKLGSGKGDDFGQGGGTTRMDSMEAGSKAGNMAMMAKRADTAYAQASMKGLRSDSLKSAAHHMRQAADAVSKGAPIAQVSELKRKVIGELKKAKTELGEGSAANLDGRSSTSMLSDIVEASQDEAPEKYRGLVSEYYKKLNDAL
jgi:hypothetical protein